MKRVSAYQWMLIIVAGFMLWSGYRPKDYPTWFFEIVLGFTGIIVLVLTKKKFQFSDLVYLWVGVHFAVLAVGGKYTYGEMPLFNWLRDTFHLSRNHFDRLGHFFQGFVPALIARELILRKSKMERGFLLNFLCVCFCLAFSAFYEILEWQVVVWCYPTSGPEWLGWQGDIWDAQGDMLMALIGSSLAMIFLSRLHDKSIQKLTTK